MIQLAVFWNKSPKNNRTYYPTRPVTVNSCLPGMRGKGVIQRVTSKDWQVEGREQINHT